MSTQYATDPTGLHVEFDARLRPAGYPLKPDDPPAPSSWFITHGLGGPAEGTFTEVEFDAGEPVNLEHIIEPVVREVAVQLYGTAWAFTYRPTEFADAIARHGLRRRERVVVAGIEVLS